MAFLDCVQINYLIQCFSTQCQCGIVQWL